MQLSMSSSASAAKDKDTPLNVKVADKVISTLFSIKPLFKIASTKARSSMIERGLKIDVDWQKNVKSLQADIEILSKEFDGVKNSKLVYPDYYLKPFHAYDDGNLSWQAAMEVESAALTVHAPIFTATKTELDRNGDFTLRDNFHKNMLKMFVAKGFRPKRILDIGCSTGLSTLKLAESFPDSQIIGLDLSPYMLAVAKHQLYSAFKDAKVTYMHGCGEDTGLGSNDVDLVSMCLINHELPSDVSKQIFQEAYRVLPSGGVISIMDMNPRSLFFQKFAANPFAFTGTPTVTRAPILTLKPKPKPISKLSTSTIGCSSLTTHLQPLDNPFYSVQIHRTLDPRIRIDGPGADPGRGGLHFRRSARELPQTPHGSGLQIGEE